jgi:hypothetical protein
MQWRSGWAVGFVLVLSLSACGEDETLGLEGSSGRRDALRRPEWHNCTTTDFKPAPAQGFSSWQNRLKTRVAARHSTQDLIVLPGSDTTIHKTFAYGLIGWRLALEPVDLYADDCSAWQPLGNQKTDLLGEIKTPYASAGHGIGQYSIMSNVLGDGSVIQTTMRVLPPKTKFVVLDIDGTLTTKDTDMLQNVANDLYWPLARHDYVPEVRAGAAELSHIWHEKGYLILYLTGRPKIVRQDTLDWLKQFNFAPGTLHMTEHRMELLPRIIGVGKYKAAYLESLADMGYEFEYAYGDAATDLYAFKAAGIPRERTYWTGAEALADGAHIVQNGDYRTTFDELRALPMAEQPFDLRGTDTPE